MTIEVRPATAARFDDVATMLGPKNPAATVCWCLSHRLDAKSNRSLVGPARGELVRELCHRAVAPGVLAYDDGEVVGWAAVAPRSELPFARSRKIPHVDDLPVWSAWRLRARGVHQGGRRRLGLGRVPARPDAAGPSLTGPVPSRPRRPLAGSDACARCRSNPSRSTG